MLSPDCGGDADLYATVIDSDGKADIDARRSAAVETAAGIAKDAFDRAQLSAEEVSQAVEDADWSKKPRNHFLDHGRKRDMSGNIGYLYDKPADVYKTYYEQDLGNIIPSSGYIGGIGKGQSRPFCYVSWPLHQALRKPESVGLILIGMDGTFKNDHQLTKYYGC